MSPDDLTILPQGLPEPEDDGAADHLPGATLPDVPLPSTDGGDLSLARLGGDVLLVAFPWAGRPGEPLPAEGWDAIPGARGCTPEVCGFRDARLGLGGITVVGVSVQSLERLSEVATRLGLGFPLVSDQGGRLSAALGLPMFTAGGRTLLRRLTLLARDGRVERVWYPVFPPDRHAAQVAEELRSR